MPSKRLPSVSFLCSRLIASVLCRLRDSNHIAVYQILVSAVRIGDGVHILQLPDVVRAHPAVLPSNGVAFHAGFVIAPHETVHVEANVINALLLVGKERAIVTDVAGTTRDVLEEQINLNGISLNIIDTAGIRDTEDIVEKIGVTKAKEYLKEADLVIYVVDSSRELSEEDHDIIKMIEDRNAIVLLNKSDLTPVTSREEMEKLLDKKVISVSAKEHLGINELEETIKTMFFHGKLEFNDEVYITNVRHKAALKNACDSLAMVRKSIADGMPEDFYSIDLMSAYEELGKIIGEAVDDDLVNEIFSKFCMGK